MKFKTPLLVWGLMGLFILVFAGLRLSGGPAPSTSSAPAFQDLGRVPNFELVERSGRKVTLAGLRGRVWICDFIFTHCSSICPMMTMKMSRLEESLRDLDDLRFVSFSVDPKRDTPARLKSYASIYTQQEDRWLFLTGEKDAVQALSRGGFHLTAMDRPAAEVGPGEDPIAHSERFVLVDREGVIRGYYSSTESGSLETLEEDARTLVRIPSNHGDTEKVGGERN